MSAERIHEQYQQIRASMPNLSFAIGFGFEYNAVASIQLANCYIDADGHDTIYASTPEQAAKKLFRLNGITAVQQYIDRMGACGSNQH